MTGFGWLSVELSGIDETKKTSEIRGLKLSMELSGIKNWLRGRATTDTDIHYKSLSEMEQSALGSF